MKHMKRRTVTVRRQASAVYGYATAVFTLGLEVGIMARSMDELESIFNTMSPGSMFVRKKVRRVLWVDARKVSTSKALKWPPPLNGRGE
jgi:hypothetical protein